MVQWFMWTEPFLQLFIPNATCFECPDCGGFPSIDVVLLLKPAGPDMVMEWTEALELSMEFEALTPPFHHHLQCLLAIVLSQLLCPAVRLFLLPVV